MTPEEARSLLPSSALALFEEAEALSLRAQVRDALYRSRFRQATGRDPQSVPGAMHNTAGVDVDPVRIYG